MRKLLIAGLGNPGKPYEATRHNVGFMFLDYLGSRLGAPLGSSKWNALAGRAKWRGVDWYLVKPLTFMNRSGEAVAAVAAYYDIPAVDTVVVHDDIDMQLGRIKLVEGGGSGGHNGIRSVVQHLGTPGFLRLKIGIGRPGTADVHPDIPVDKYVLSRFTPEELQFIEARFADIERGIEFLAEGDVPRARTLLNSLK